MLQLQLNHKFNNLQTLAGLIVPENTPTELAHCFQVVREYKTALPDLIISGLSLLHYERNIMCSTNAFCALKLVNHQLIQPGREKLMPEFERTDLQQMYGVFIWNLKY